MKRIVLSVAIATSFIVPAAAFACEGEAHQAKAELSKVTVDQLVALQKDKKATVIDANDMGTRKKYGVIPGAVLLTSSASFEAKELPADKASKLVFYCSNDLCTASNAAAKRAIENGYTDVAVLSTGVQGWQSAGQKLVKPQS
ncbi:MAG: rhodanese-like domain-containing protein [Archangium sp.]